MDGENLSFDNGISYTNADVTKKDNDNENRSAFERLESPQEMIGHLRDELAMANAEILRLKAKVNEYELCFVQEGSGIVNQRNELLKLLFQRDNTIERKSIEINILEKQLEAAVNAKFEALTRLDANGGNVLTDLTFSLTNNQPEIMAERQRKRDKLQNNSDNKVDAARQTKQSRKHATNADDNLEATTSRHLVHDVINSEIDQANLSTSHENRNDSIRIQNELLSEVRTRRQNQFVLDAFSKIGGSEASESVNQDLPTKNGRKMSDQKPPRSSNNVQTNHRYPFVKLKKMKLSF
ncbi:uncharacterized protein LOC119080279 isoform X2 [Bradysia coprophila]|uniref:uncharacterized protein LOC119080279 isoform X2 n=1 Tax=Bradysia coprophila TaxID=38358 RepID=UPI00187DAC29|nr:uncharacterized protein LOC119080279 isoform X2 [Bradysia coprophila]